MADEPSGPIKEKLVRSKQKGAEEGRGLTGTTADPSKVRLPPGQRLTQDFPVLDLGVQPNVSQADWSLTVAGQVAHPLKWDWQAFMAQPQLTLTNDIHCVTTW